MAISRDSLVPARSDCDTAKTVGCLDIIIVAALSFDPFGGGGQTPGLPGLFAKESKRRQKTTLP